MPDYQTKFRIGIRNPKTHRLDFAFNIERPEGGGIRITGIKRRLSDQERHTLFSHFGRPKEGMRGGKVKDALVTSYTLEEPGTPIHFERACRSVPAPFNVMSANYEKYLRRR